MVNKIIDGVSVKLNEAFGDTCEIYSEEVKQDFKVPCFFILPLNPSQRQMIGSRYYRNNPFDIHYFPKSKEEKNAEIYSVAETLCEALEYINIDGNFVRGNRMRYEKVEGVLHFFVEYNKHVIRQIEKIPMEELTATSGLKG